MTAERAIIAASLAASLLALAALRLARKPAKKPAFARKPVDALPALKDDCILRALKGLKTDRVPVWMMRQAGRYLPEFRALRVEHDFFHVCRTPELACEVTVQPLDRFGPSLLSACIIFSDILVVPQAMGMDVKMLPGKGPHFPAPLRQPSDVLKLPTKVDVEKELGYVFDALNLTRVRIDGRVPLIGFSGAPFTLMAYMVEGEGSRTLSKAKRWLYEWPAESHALLQRICDVIVDYLIGQVTKGGAQALQVFESNAGDLSPRLWEDFSLPYLTQIAARVRAAVGPSVPLIVFSRGSNWEGALEALAKSEYDCIGLDWTIDPAVARKRVGLSKSLQGNLCPATLFASPAVIRQETRDMLKGFGPGGLVANLGHGMEPSMDPEHAKAFLEAVCDWTGA